MVFRVVQAHDVFADIATELHRSHMAYLVVSTCITPSIVMS